ncbi:unnamed protein product [Cylicocyclus nassatus]|uniref:HORMA domain-containing protein n=1 Tax=Cylicocyclus nassatus TaxID=53992 RepID=A0AA36GG14_CYLNA|nr:unnamed protein product [Cylicocyclus nassatus]
MQKSIIMAIAGAVAITVLIATGITLAVVLTRKGSDPGPEEEQNSTTIMTNETETTPLFTLGSTETENTKTETVEIATVTKLPTPERPITLPTDQPRNLSLSDILRTKREYNRISVPFQISRFSLQFFVAARIDLLRSTTPTPSHSFSVRRAVCRSGLYFLYLTMPPFAAGVKKNPFRKEVNKTWSGTFPENVDGLIESTTFITRCMYITFCHILACRRLMPSNVFKKRIIDGDLRAYVMDTTELLGARFVQKFKGINSAVEKGYLQELMLVVSPTDEDDMDAIELYTWRMRYDTDGDPQAELTLPDGTVMAALRFQGMQFLKNQVTELLLALRALCRESLSPLPPTASAAVRITYTDRTPKGYQAPGFYRSPDDPVLRPDAQKLEIVAFQTKHHGASIAVNSIFIDDSYAVGLRLKETMKLDGLDDSLNQSFGEEQGAGDEIQTSNETLERISGPIEGQSDTMEIPRDGEREVQNTSTMSTSTMDARGSSINTNLSESTTEDVRPKRGRRGHPAAVKVKPGQAIEERARSPVVVSASPKRMATPGPEVEEDNNGDTPPTKRTPGFVKTTKITPKQPPQRRRY